MGGLSLATETRLALDKRVAIFDQECPSLREAAQPL
jgi:hypothetical protein